MKQRLRWSVLAASHAAAAAAWFTFLETPEMQVFEARNPILAFKPFRTYLSVRWGLARRGKVLRDTYALVARKGGVLRRALLEDGGVPLASLALGGFGDLEVNLGFDNRFRKEGEFRISLVSRRLGKPILSAAFSFESDAEGRLVCYVGCIQGWVGGKDMFKELTKQLHGHRPKALMIFLLQEMARALGAETLLGVGTSIQAHRRKHLLHIPFIHALHFDYDQMWTEAGGHPNEEGWFRLPLRTLQKGAEEIRPNKRGQYARRHALLEALSREVQGAFAAGG